MSRDLLDKWDSLGLRLAWEVSQQSKDPSSRVGAYVADSMHRPVSFGFNGFPRGIKDDERLLDRETKYKMIVHAEMNAILNANRDLVGCTMYVYPYCPCAACASALIQKAVSRVVCVNTVVDRWISDFVLAQSLFKEAGVEYLLVDPSTFCGIVNDLEFPC